MYYNKNTKTIFSSLPQSHVFTGSSALDEPIADGCSTGEFHLWDEKYHIAEGFLPFKDIKPEFNSDTATIIPQEIIVSEDKNSASRKWIVVQKTKEQLAIELDAVWQSIRDTRNQLLKKSDWTQLADVPANPEWIVYRQTLRDITDMFDTPDAVIFPDKPS